MSRFNRLMQLAAVLFVTPAAWGQYTNIALNRPSGSGPSQRVGLIGGLGTRTTTNSTQLGRARGLDALRLPTPTELHRGSSLPRIDAPIAFQLGSPGFEIDAQPVNVFRFQGGASGSQLMYQSGLEHAQSRQTPLTGWAPAVPRAVETAYYAPKPDRSPFNRYFGLQSAPSVTAPVEQASGEPSLNYADLLEDENRIAIQKTLARAHDAFKKGTDPDVEGRQEQLTRAIELYANVSRIDREAVLPGILTIHAALEKGQLMVAGRALLEIVRRDSSVFLAPTELRRFFGDPRVLDVQLRTYRRVGELNPGSTFAFALQAYCNWLLDDSARAREALAKMETLNRQQQNLALISNVGHALSAALK